MPACGSLCLEAAEGSQWPRLYSFGRPNASSVWLDFNYRIHSLSLLLHTCAQRVVNGGCVWNRTVSCLPA